MLPSQTALWRHTHSNNTVLQWSGTNGSRAKRGSFDDGIWLVWYFLDTIVTNETFSIIFHLPDYKAISSTRSRINSKKNVIKDKLQTFAIA